MNTPTHLTKLQWDNLQRALLKANVVVDWPHESFPRVENVTDSLVFTLIHRHLDDYREANA